MKYFARYCYNKVFSKLLARKIHSIAHHISSREIGKNQKIPYNIFQTFKDKNRIPYRMKKAIDSWIINNPEYNYYFFDDNDIESYLLSYNCDDFCFSIECLRKAYKKIIPGAGKADIFRLMVIYEYGGIYMDVDTICINPLSTFVDPEDEVVSGLGSRGDFHQWGLIYTKNHPFIKKALENSVNNILNETFINGFPCLEGLSGPPCLDISIKQILGKDLNFIFQPGRYCENGIRYTLLPGDHFNKNVLFKYPNYEQDLGFAGTEYWLSNRNNLFNKSVEL